MIFWFVAIVCWLVGWLVKWSPVQPTPAIAGMPIPRPGGGSTPTRRRPPPYKLHFPIGSYPPEMMLIRHAHQRRFTSHQHSLDSRSLSSPLGETPVLGLGLRSALIIAARAHIGAHYQQCAHYRHCVDGIMLTNSPLTALKLDILISLSSSSYSSSPSFLSYATSFRSSR